MIFETSRVIKAAMDAQNLRCAIDEAPSSSAVVTGFDLRSGDAATLHFISMGEHNDVALRVFHFAKGDPAKLLSVVNELNCKFRYAKFALRDGEVCVEMDIPQETVDLGKVAMEYLGRCLDIMAEAAPDLKAAGATLQPAQSAAPAEPKAEAEPAPQAEASKKRFGFFGGGNGK